jgi:hypothetical protein
MKWGWFHSRTCVKWGDSEFLEGPSDSYAEKVAENISHKMQEMWPIPNGELEVTVYPRESFNYSQKKMPVWTIMPLVSQRTLSYFELIREYHTWCETHRPFSPHLARTGADCPERVVVLVNSRIANPSVPVMDRAGGFVKNSGMTPCSRSSVINTHGIENIADTAIHEMGHGVLLGHDNFILEDHTINNCGLESLYKPGERATGWNPDGTDVSSALFQ